MEQFTTIGTGDQFIGGETFRGSCDSSWDPAPPEGDTGGGGPAMKTIAAHNNSSNSEPITLVMTVHPNPSSTVTRICVEDLPADIPAVVEVINLLGETVATLYNAIPDAECGLCLTLDCSKLENGTYYAHIQNGNMVQAVKLTVEH